jgi:hypothetical protein
MNTKKQIIRTATIWVVLIGFMMLTQPQKLPVLLLVVPFVLLFAGLLNIWALLVPLTLRITGRRGYQGSKRLRYTVCGSLVLLAVMQSLGQLTLRDVGTIIAIAVIGYVYIGRSRSQLAGR